jgi:hypothetical protein
MTTGRINQVTILKPAEGPRRAPRGRPPPVLTGGGGVVVRSERRTARPGARDIGALSAHASGARGHPIAPAEFPKGRSAAEPIGG